MPFADLPDDVRLHYRFDGEADAPPLVLSNSLGTDLAMWEPQMPALSARFRVLRYDTRGHGQSDACRRGRTRSRSSGATSSACSIALGIEPGAISAASRWAA